MLCRTLLFSAAASLASATAAAPAKPADQAPQQADRPAQVLLASAEQPQPQLPAVVQEASATPAKKPRAARVTSCRCADQATTDR